jgi:SAM-dependent methyltransferase
MPDTMETLDPAPGAETPPAYFCADDDEHLCPNPPGPLRLNLGAGGTVIDGYKPVDIKKGVDVRRLPYLDATVDAIYASHVLEHLAHAEIVPTLMDWARAMKPGGLLQVAVPDVEWIAANWSPLSRDHLRHVLMGGQTDRDDYHRSAFDEHLLRRAMHAAGFGFVERFEPFVEDCSRHPCSLNLQARKRWWPRVDNPRVCMVLVKPRLGFTDTADDLQAIAFEMGKRYPEYHIQPSFGAFWDRDICLATQAAIHNHNPDILLYADYDGAFTAGDAVKIVETLNNDPTLAACGPVQMSRHDDRPLVFKPELDYSGPRTDVPFSHFGLTAIRRQVFEELPQPWFWSIPGPDETGQPAYWGTFPSSDADITFWRVMAEHGFRVQQCNDVVIGHLVLCVKWPKDSGYGVSLQPIEDYRKHGRPASARLAPDIYRKRMAEQAEAMRKAQEASSG